MPKSDSTRMDRGFTLVELILVMALLAIVTALSIPSLSGSMRQRHLKDEATRFLALTEYGRDEAISQGVPMSVWVNSAAGRIGVEAKTGFSGIAGRERAFSLNSDIHLQIEKSRTGAAGLIVIAEFGPDGSPSLNNVDQVLFVDRFASSLTLARTHDGWAYEILKDSK